MKVSIIIPTRNRLDSLKACVSHIREHTSLPYELIICNHASIEEGYPEYLDSLDAVIVNVPSATCYSEVMNAGLRIATGDYLTIPGIANDIEVTRNWLEPILEMMEADPTIGMGVFGVQEKNHGTVFGAFLNPDRFNFDPNKEPHYAGYGLVSRQCFEAVGELDENYKPIYLEDADYGIRVKEAGFRLQPHPDSLIIHHHEQSDRHPNTDDNREYFNIKWRNWVWE